MSHTERVVVLVDMDCFYCQVEEKLNPQLEGKPIAVVQYNAWRGGGIIAVNYPARDKGVTRHMRGQEAKEKCPEINLVKVPEVRGKADLTKYREAGKRVAEVLQTFTQLLERASVDEAYLDITKAVDERIKQNPDEIFIDKVQNTHALGSDIKDFVINCVRDRVYCERNFKLAVGAWITEEIRAEVFKRTGYKCSAGIAHNKILAKLACGLHKPNQQTILPHDAVPQLYKNLPVRKIKSLGGKFGNVLTEELKINTMEELGKFSESQLAKSFGEKNANFLYNIAQGIDMEPVVVKLISKSIGCCKRFPGKTSLIQPEDVHHWVNELASEISERLDQDVEENNRKAKQIIISFSQKIDKTDVSSSRTQQLISYEHSKIVQIAMDVLKKHCLRSDGNYHITFLGLSASNFEEIKKVKEITSFFSKMSSKPSIESQNNTPSTSTKIKKNIASFFNSITSNENLCNVPQQTSIDKKDILCNTNTLPHISSESNFITTHKSDTSKYSEIVNVENNEFNEITIMQDNCQEQGNESIYSATTEELDEELDDLIFYDDIMTKKNNYDVHREHCINESNIEDMKRPSSSSFFKKYFNDFPERNFNTSKIFDDNSSISSDETNTKENSSNIIYEEAKVVTNDENSNEVKEICTECNKLILVQELPSHLDYHVALKLAQEESDYPKKSAGTEEQLKKNVAMKKDKNLNKKSISAFFKKTETCTSNMQIKGMDQEIENNEIEICPDCKKKIPKLEFTSHMDYHFALKIVNEEKHLYTSPPVLSVNSKQKNPNIKNKRKTNNSDPKCSIKSFFTNVDQGHDEDNRACEQCYKRIKLSDYVSHIDYHEAKKLHMQLNSSEDTILKPV